LENERTSISPLVISSSLSNQKPVVARLILPVTSDSAGSSARQSSRPSIEYLRVGIRKWTSGGRPMASVATDEDHVACPIIFAELLHSIRPGGIRIEKPNRVIGLGASNVVALPADD